MKVRLLLLTIAVTMLVASIHVHADVRDRPDAPPEGGDVMSDEEAEFWAAWDAVWAYEAFESIDDDLPGLPPYDQPTF